MTNISVVIPTWNSARTIVECLRSIQKQDLSPYEIIVVDNGSKDATTDLVTKHFPEVKLIKLKTNSGVVGGRNAGILATSKHSSHILFFDHDMIAAKTMLRELLSTSIINNAAIVTPKILYKNHPDKVWAAGTEVNLLTGQVLFHNSGGYIQDQSVQIAPAAIFVDKKVIRKVGMFDAVFHSSWEDADFCLRAKKAGFKTFLSHSSIAYHDLALGEKPDADRLFDRYGYYIGQNRIIFMKRYSSNYEAFVLFMLPTYLLYYLSQAIKYKKYHGYIEFIRGTWNGIVHVDQIKNIKMVWGEDPEFSGPRDWYRNTVLIDEVVRRRASGRVLDYGCGSGNLLFRLSKLGNFVCTGVDVSSSAIRYASERVKHEGLNNLSFIKADNSWLKKNRTKYDVIICGEVIEHIRDDSDFVKSLYNRLNPNGIVVSSVPAHKKYWDINDDFSSHLRRYEIDDFCKLFETNGYQKLSIYYWGWPLTYFWHKYVYVPLVGKKIKSGIKYSGSPGLLGLLFSNHTLKRLASHIFAIDKLFNWTGRGGGIIGVFSKN